MDGGDFEKDRKHMRKSTFRSKGTGLLLSMACQPLGYPGADVQELVRNVHRRET